MIIDLKNIQLSKYDRKKFSKLLKRNHDYNSVTYWCAWIGFMFGLLTCTILITNILLPQNNDISVYGTIGYKILFNFFTYFTEQSNILVIITYFLFLTLYRTRLFNNRNLVLAVGIYINLTMFTYWTIMMPQWVAHKLVSYAWWSVFGTISFHLVCPVIYDFFLLWNPNYPCSSIKNPLNRLHSSLFPWILLIYPFCYALYVIIINFTKLPPEVFNQNVVFCENGIFYYVSDGEEWKKRFTELTTTHNFVSVYNQITNFNSNCWFIKYGTDTDINIAYFDTESAGSVFYVLIVSPVALIFIINVLWIITMNNHFSTPKTMMMEILFEYKRIKAKNATIYSRYVKTFNKKIQKKIKK